MYEYILRERRPWGSNTLNHVRESRAKLLLYLNLRVENSGEQLESS